MEKERTPFTWLIHAHDHIWRDGGWPLRVRVDACQAIWEIVCAAPRGSRNG